MKKYCLLLLVALAACSPRFEVYDLRCEGLVEPLGIDSCEPHFSWKIRSEEPMRQAAYELQVQDLWNSGKVESDEQIMVPYEGPMLASRQQALWRVRVWRQDGKVSRWSPWTRFGVGIVAPDTLRGAYIGAVPGEGRAPLLRKRFTAPGGKGLLYVNSLGYHEVFLNGQKVSDQVLAPAVSQLDKRSLIVVYELALRKGENELCLAAGSGWYKKTTFGTVYDGPLVKAELDVEGEPLLVTDDSWEGAWSGYRDLGDWRPHGFVGERIEAGVEPVWGPVDVVDVPAGIRASMQMCEPCRVQEVLEPVSVEPYGSGWRMDMGRCINALAEIQLPPLPAGQVVTVRYSDVDIPEFDPEICGYDQLVSSGKPEGDVFVNRFNHHVFRYIQIDSLVQKPLRVRAHRMRTDFPKESAFQCSDLELQAIYDLVDHTVENLTFNGYMVDCASIERLGYGGDGTASALTLQTMASTAPLYLNWLQAWADAQRPDGGLPHTAPNPYTAGGGPYWCSFLVQAAWQTYLSYADRRPVERYYPAMKHWLDYVDAYSVDGLLKRWPDEPYRGWYLGDWAAPQGVDVQDPASVDLVNNCALMQVYQALEQIALLLNEKADAAAFRLRGETLGRRIQQAFYHSEDGTYASGSQLDLVYPLLTGVTPAELRDKVISALKERTATVYDGHLATGLVGVPVITRWATLSGEAEWLYGLLKQHSYPGYLYMLDNGATGVWEEWDGGRSRLHNCYNGIGSWFYEALAGIVPLEPGYRRVRIAPQLTDKLEWVTATVGTPYGPLTVRRQGKEIQVDAPVGIEIID